VATVDTALLNYIDKLFESIANDHSLRDDIKSQLLSLRIPVIHICSEDNHFFSDNTHPARLNLILLTYLGSNFPYSKNLVLITSRIVDDLIHSDNLSIDDFNRANAVLIKQCDMDMGLSSLYETIHNRTLLSTLNQIKQKPSKFKKDGNREYIRQIIITEMQQIISNNTLPKESHDLLLKLWPTLLHKIFLKHGENSREWSDSLKFYQRLIESIQPITSQQQLLVLKHDRVYLSQTILDLFTDYKLINQRSLNAVTNIVKIYTSRITSSGFSNPVLSKSKPFKNKPHPTISSIQQLKLADFSLEKLPDYVRPGQWFDLYTSNNTPLLRLKLSVIVLDEGKLIFVDHKGLKAMEKDALIFCDELDRGLSLKVSAYNNFKNTWNTLISKISNLG
jgi:Protein of unknown function (DUF1631)